MIVLERWGYKSDGTYGYLRLPGRIRMPTIEQPWRDNQANQSCIPEGRYELEPDDTGKFKYFRIPDDMLLGRTAIELHPANVPGELRGCIAPGLAWGTFDGVPGIMESRKACERIQELLPDGDELWITAPPRQGILGGTKR